MQSKGKEKKNTIKLYYCLYTLLFFILFLCVFQWHFKNEKSFIWKVDGWYQHYKSLVYYSKYLRGIFRSLFIDHKLSIPQWDFNIGQGSDILGTLHYYVIGDPFTFFSVLIPVKYMYYYYAFIVSLRMFLSGIAFSVLCFEKQIKNKYGVLVGALSYAFCCWNIYYGTRHPYFVNPMVYLPLLIVGIDRIIEKKSPVLFIIMVMISGLSNFYFFYMLVIVLLIYGFIRCFFLFHDNISKAFLTIWEIFKNALIGVLMAGIILVPILMVFLTDSRLSVSHPYHLLYSKEYYQQFFTPFFAFDGQYGVCIGLSACTFLAALAMFSKRKKDTHLKVFYLLCLIFLMIPFFGQLMNGMSYVTNRWCWAFILLCTFILAKYWDDLLHLEWTRIIIVFVGFAFVHYVLMRYADIPRIRNGLKYGWLCFAVIAARYDNKYWKMIRQTALCCLIACNIGRISYWLNSPGQSNAIDAERDLSGINYYLYNNVDSELKNLASDDEEHIRISGNFLPVNANILQGMSSTQYYWTNSNSFVNNYKTVMEVSETELHDQKGFDDRTELLGLESVNYYIEQKSVQANVPYGYSQINLNSVKDNEIKNNYTIYKNDYPLPIAYTYQNYISDKSWQNANAVQKQELLMHGVYLDGYAPDSIAEYKSKPEKGKMLYSISSQSDGIEIKDHQISCGEKESSVTLEFKGDVNSETYLEITGFDYKKLPESGNSFKNKYMSWGSRNSITLDISVDHNVQRKISYLNEDALFTAGRHDIIANLGYSEQGFHEITIIFPYEGTYTFDAVNIYCRNLDSYEDNIKELKKDVLGNFVIDTNTVKGKIDVNTPKMLNFAIPYAKGWTAYINGKKQKLFLSNEHHMALELLPGENTVELRYRTPYLTVGTLVSIVGWIIFLLKYKRNRKERAVV